MPELEALAIATAIESLERYGCTIAHARLFTDSETVIRGAHKGHSTKCPAINPVVALILRLHITIEHVQSASNPADNLSRDKPFSEQDQMNMDNLCALPFQTKPHR